MINLPAVLPAWGVHLHIHGDDSPESGDFRGVFRTTLNVTRLGRNVGDELNLNKSVPPKIKYKIHP